MSSGTAIVWFDLNLRLADNPALEAAIAKHETVIPVFIWAPEEEDPWAPGAASRWWLHQSLREVNASLERHGSRLILRRGPTATALSKLTEETGARTVYWNRRYEPAVIARDRDLKQTLAKEGIALHSLEGNVLFEPGTVLHGRSGKPYQVFTPFWTAIQQQSVSKPSEAPKELKPASKWPPSLNLSDLDLQPKIDWAQGLRASWKPGETGASEALEAFTGGPLEDYGAERDRPDHGGTSRVSPHLHFGEISVRSIWHAAKASAYRRELAWREFSYHLLYHFPHTSSEPLRSEFREFPWRLDEKAFTAWTQGKTGYPLVDAGMRELWHTGWMHNRVRMVAASFLVKHLLIPWLEGAHWFWDTLVDADLANNTMGWQWSVGCGADAAPYFRIFNPSAQREKFDPQCEYVRRWVPELGSAEYPQPIVEHGFARKRALAAFATLKKQRDA